MEILENFIFLYKMLWIWMCELQFYDVWKSIMVLGLKVSTRHRPSCGEEKCGTRPPPSVPRPVTSFMFGACE